MSPGCALAAGLAVLRELAEFFYDLPLLGETALFMFRIDHLVTDRDVEDTVTAFDELRIHAELFLDFSRQTGGSR